MKFYVINGTQKTLVNAGGDWKIKPTREDNSVGFRFKFSGSIILTDKDFDIIRAVEIENKFKKLYLEIWIEENGFHRKFWYGYFTPFTCKWNNQNSTVEFTPTVIDEYTNLVENIEIEKNILDVDPADTFAGQVLGDTEVLVFSQDIDLTPGIQMAYNNTHTPPNVSYIQEYNNSLASSKEYQHNGYYWEPIINNVYISTQLQTDVPAFLKKPNAVITPAQLGVDITTLNDKLAASFVLLQMDYIPLGGYMYNVSMKLARQIKITKDVNGVAVPPSSGTWIQAESTNVAGLPAHKYVRTYGEFAALLNASESFGLRQGTDGSFTYYRSTTNASKFDSGRWLTEVFDYFLNDFQLTLKSDFLQSDVNPVTNESENPTKLLQILQKSDAKYPSATEPAANGYIKFNDLLFDICVLFNLRWWVDGSYFRIEHVSNLPETSDVDATTYSGNKNKRDYSYDSENIPHRQTLSFMDSTEDIDFTGLPIEYDSENTSGKTKDNTVDLKASNISTDIAQVLLTPSEVTNNGFVLVSVNDNNGSYHLRNDIGILTGAVKSNGYLTASNLISKFYNHKMPLPTATVNGELKTFASTQRRKKIEGITFPYTEINGFSLVKTELGWGEIDDAELDLKTMLYTTTIKA